MRLVLVGTRNGKPTVNLVFTLIVILITALAGTGIALLIGSLSTDSMVVDVVGWSLSVLPPILVVVLAVLPGLKIASAIIGGVFVIGGCILLAGVAVADAVFRSSDSNSNGSSLGIAVLVVAFL